MANDLVLVRLRTTLTSLYSARLERVLLFGSRARGEARPESDYDVAVFLEPLDDRWVELDRLADLRVNFLDEIGAFIDAKPYSADAYRAATPLMHEIRREGVELSLRKAGCSWRRPSSCSVRRTRCCQSI